MRSQLEAKIAEFLQRRDINFAYEPDKLPYTIDFEYIPDFRLPNGIYLEAKGLLTYEDRRKMLAVKKHHPELDIRFVFMRPNNTIAKGSKTTYAQWSERNGFPWCNYQQIPSSWLNSPSKSTPTTTPSVKTQ
jgi:hypothetical protein